MFTGGASALPEDPWLENITITSGTFVQTVTFGTNESGSDGYDQGLDLLAPPPSPSPVVDVYFPVDHFVFDRLYGDIRYILNGANQERVWTLQVLSKNEDALLAWDSTTLPADIAFTLSVAGSEYDMKEVASVSLTKSTSYVPVTIQARYSSIAAPNANFTASVTSGPVPLTVQFTDTSTGNPSSWLWSFGDGATSTEQNPTHTYLAAGIYYVNLTVSNSEGSNTLTQTAPTVVLQYGDINFDGIVNIVDALAILQHNVGLRNITEPLALMQGDLHQNGLLDVGDAQIITHYNVGLDTLTPRVSETDFSSVELIVVPGARTIPAGEQAALNITLVDAENVGSYDITLRWDPTVLDLIPKDNISFQDLGVQYITAGEARLVGILLKPANGDLTLCTLRFTAIGSSGSSSLVTIPSREYSILKAYSCNSIPFTVSTATVTVSEPTPVANFTANVTSGPAPLTVQFTDLSTGNPTTWLWGFGDGSTSMERHPTHTYTAAGTYTVNLTVTSAGGSNTTTMTQYVTVLDAMPIGLGDAGAAKGQTTQALLAIRNASAIASGSLNLTYDPAVVTVETVHFVSPWMGASNIINTNGKTRLAYYSGSGYGQSGDVPLCTVTLKATGEPGETCPLNVTVDLLANADGKDLSFAALPVAGGFQVLYPDTSDPIRYRDAANGGLYKGILSGNTLYFGEEGLNLTHLGSVQRLVHYSNFSAGTVDATLNVPDCHSFNVVAGESPSTGRYYAWGDDGLLNGRPWVEIRQPITGLDVFLGGTNTSVDGVTLTRNVVLDFALENNLEGLHATPAAAAMDIEITTPGGGKLTQFGATDLSGIPIEASMVYIRGISLSSADPGSYTARAVWPSASDFAGKGYDSNAVTFDIVERSLTIGAGTNRVMRGQAFNVTISGDTRAQYILYVREANLTSENEYPLIAPGQPGVQTGDIVTAPADAADFALTRAYAVTDLAGYHTVQFNTSPATAQQRFTIRVVDAATGLGSAEVTVRVGQGQVTLTASGEGSATIGDEITLSGINSDSSTVYLFLTGPDLTPNGVKLSDPGVFVVNGTPDTFTTVTVRSDDTWEYRWNTSAIAGSLTDGLYTVYAAAAPRPQTALEGIANATFDIQFSSPVNASFTSNVTSGPMPLAVSFTDQSTGAITSWLWSFGDGNTSTEQHPLHTYTAPGTYSVNLTVTSAAGSDTLSRPGYITVTRVKGDFGGDGIVDIGDVSRVAHMVVGKAPTDPAADFNENGAVDIGDAAKIAYYYVGKILAL